MKTPILIAHAKGEEHIAEKLAEPLRQAGYTVAHEGTVMVGDSVLENASKILALGGPVILCGTITAVGTKWARRVINAATGYSGVKLYAVQMEQDADLASLCLDTKIAEYWKDPNTAVGDLIASVKRDFPREESERAKLDERDAHTLIQDYLREQAKFYEAQEWTKRAITLEVVDNQGKVLKLRKALMDWALMPNADVLLLTGDFGSGKTWTLRWLARELAQRRIAGTQSTPVPVLVPLARLVTKQPQRLSDLLGCAVPMPLKEEALASLKDPIAFLLDGLDELVSSSVGISQDPFSTLSEAIRFAPPKSRILITCRTQVLEEMKESLERCLEDCGTPDPQDKTSDAINRALGRGRPKYISLAILEVQDADADAFLSGSKAKQFWNEVRKQPAYRELARLPFTIFLLEEALPHLAAKSTQPSLSDLYQAAVETWISRDQRPSDRAKFCRQLEDIAAGMFLGRFKRSREIDRCLLDLGILKKMKDQGVEFRHYSLFEYFIARAVARQMANFSSALLQRLNLVYMYNVNRFLIPILLKEHKPPQGKKRSPTRAKKAVASWPVVMKKGRNRELASTVTIGQYIAFLRDTNWRAGGYGVWTVKAAADGTQPFEGQDAHLKESLDLDSMNWSVPDLSESERPVTSVSWYDAFQFCRWAKGRLPSSNEVTRFDDESGAHSIHEWTSSWIDEKKSLIAVSKAFSSTGRCKLQGVNPDMRSKLIGFRVVWD